MRIQRVTINNSFLCSCEKTFMGYNFGLRRNRMEPARLGDLPDELLVALGEKNFKLMHYDEQIIFDKINARLDKKQAEFNSKTVVK